MEVRNYITLTIDNKQPMEVKEFIGVLQSLNNQYEKYIRKNYPDLISSSHFQITEIRKGSTIIDLLPTLFPLIEHINHANIIDDFVTKWTKRLKTYFNINGRDHTANKSDLHDLLDFAKLISTDPKAAQSLDYIEHEDGQTKSKTKIKFGSKEAQRAIIEISEHLREIEVQKNADYERVTMFFEMPSKTDGIIGKRSGEKVIIDVIDKKAKPLIYSSHLAEKQIKHELLATDENPFQKAFIVDVNVDVRNEKAWAYRVTHVHQIIPLDDE